MTSGARVVKGFVDRISGSGNAMLETKEGDELNLGPVSEEVVGENVSAIKLSGLWGLCLDTRFVTEDYLSELSSLAGRPTDELRSLTNGNPFASEKSAGPEDVGRIVRTEGQSDLGVVEYDGGKPISVELPELFAEFDIPREMPVEIVAVRRGVALGCPALEHAELDDTGDAVEVVVQREAGKSEGAVVGHIAESGVPVLARGQFLPEGVVVLTGVSHVLIHMYPRARHHYLLTPGQTSGRRSGYPYTKCQRVVLDAVSQRACRSTWRMRSRHKRGWESSRQWSLTDRKAGSSRAWKSCHRAHARLQGTS
jgi:hypothetical protein